MRNKLLSWLFAAFVLFFMVKNPAGAAHLAMSLMHALGAAGDGIGLFVTELSKAK